jgi:hypothetical protein
MAVSDWLLRRVMSWATVGVATCVSVQVAVENGSGVCRQFESCVSTCLIEYECLPRTSQVMHVADAVGCAAGTVPLGMDLRVTPSSEAVHKLGSRIKESP